MTVQQVGESSACFIGREDAEGAIIEKRYIPVSSMSGDDAGHEELSCIPRRLLPEVGSGESLEIVGWPDVLTAMLTGKERQEK